MRFLHTADWHLGKSLSGFSLLEDQQAIFDKIEQVAKAENVDAIVIAGDLYDRSIPSEGAITALNQMLAQLNLVDHFPILAISGNHDSATRLGNGADWFSYQDLHLNTKLADAFKPVVIGDTQFFLLPFFGIQEVRNYFADERIKDVNTAMKKICTAMQKQFAPDKKHVLLAHFFAAGSRHTADSETLVEVGGLSAVDTATLAPFDYVALGHLHNRNALQEERIKYSGSPMKFSVSEVNQDKGVWIIDTDPFTAKWVSLSPVHDIHRLKDSFANLIATHHNYSPADFYDIEITDHERIPDALVKLREYYPKIVSLHRTHQAQLVTANPSRKLKRHDPMALLADFYQQTMGVKMSTQQEKMAADALAKITNQEE